MVQRLSAHITAFQRGVAVFQCVPLFLQRRVAALDHGCCCVLLRLSLTAIPHLRTGPYFDFRTAVKRTYAFVGPVPPVGATSSSVRCVRQRSLRVPRIALHPTMSA